MRSSPNNRPASPNRGMPRRREYWSEERRDERREERRDERQEERRGELGDVQPDEILAVAVRVAGLEISRGLREVAAAIDHLPILAPPPPPTGYNPRHGHRGGRL